MAIVGVTGHSNLTGQSVEIVYREIVSVLQSRSNGLIGMTCLARGVDQIFADAVLDLGGALEVVIPARDYFSNISDPISRSRCDEYLEVAISTVTLDFDMSGGAAYLAASRYLVDHCDLLLAVWDGRATSGTADAVDYAQKNGRATVVVWPRGAQRVST